MNAGIVRLAYGYLKYIPACIGKDNGYVFAVSHIREAEYSKLL